MFDGNEYALTLVEVQVGWCNCIVMPVERFETNFNYRVVDK